MPARRMSYRHSPACPQQDWLQTPGASAPQAAAREDTAGDRTREGSRPPLCVLQLHLVHSLLGSLAHVEVSVLLLEHLQLVQEAEFLQLERALLAAL